MIYGSVCSGIEAATVAWHPLGWRAAFFSEIEAFPRAVLQHHYADVPLHGDFTTIQEGEYEPIDLLVGGTPCQGFSIAGLRAGMAGDRGNLTLQYLTLARRLRPRWMVWENVPGVLSSNGGRDFGAFLGGLGKLGYGWAYRTLDAQHFGVPQRRRRVFVVGYLGDWRYSRAVLFERHSLSGDSAPSRETRKDVAPTISARTKGGGGLGTDFDLDGGLIAKCLSASHTASGGQDPSAETYVVGTLTSNGDAHSGFKDENGLIAYSIMPQNSGRDYKAREVDVAQPIMAGGPVGGNQGGDYIVQPIPILEVGKGSSSRGAGPNGCGIGSEGDPMYTLQAGAQHAIGLQQSQIGSAVRRLTPRECERLQGFPDDYTLIPYRGKPAADGPRYKALGNSMAVPVMSWIGQRIQLVETLISNQEIAA